MGLSSWLWGDVVFVDGVCNEGGNTGVEAGENPSESLCLGENPLGPPGVSRSPWVVQIGHFVLILIKVTCHWGGEKRSKLFSWRCKGFANLFTKCPLNHRRSSQTSLWASVFFLSLPQGPMRVLSALKMSLQRARSGPVTNATPFLTSRASKTGQEPTQRTGMAPGDVQHATTPIQKSHGGTAVGVGGLPIPLQISWNHTRVGISVVHSSTTGTVIMAATLPAILDRTRRNVLTWDPF